MPVKGQERPFLGKASMSALPPERTLIDGVEKSASCHYQRSATNEVTESRSNDVEYGLLKFFHLLGAVLMGGG
jgi:hypothetical protein